MSDIAKFQEVPTEVPTAIANNDEYIAWGETLKKISKAIKQAEDMRIAIKAKIVEYRSTCEELRRELEKKELKKAAKKNQPAIVTKAIPEVDGINFRHQKKWVCRNLDQVPRAFLKLDEDRVDQTVKALGFAANIKGVEVYDHETVAVTVEKDAQCL